MGYGISMNSGFNTIQIDSDSPLSYLKVSARNTGTTVSGVSADKLVCIRPPYPSGNDANLGYGAYRTGTGPFTYTFYKNGQTVASTVDYVILEPVKLATATTGYGIQVYNSESELAFDSGIFLSGGVAENVVDMVTVLPPGTSLYGNYLFNASIIYTGSNYLEIYAAVNSSIFFGPDLAYGGFRWNTADQTIRWCNYVRILSSVYYADNTFTSIVLLKTV